MNSINVSTSKVSTGYNGKIMGEAKLGSQNIGKIFLGSQQLGGG